MEFSAVNTIWVLVGAAARKVIFVQADEIRWDAAVWYLDRFHIAKERRNQSYSG